jgi:hypothetical protein
MSLQHSQILSPQFLTRIFLMRQLFQIPMFRMLHLLIHLALPMFLRLIHLLLRTSPMYQKI